MRLMTARKTALEQKAQRLADGENIPYYEALRRLAVDEERLPGAAALIEGLMRGNREHLQMGYSLGNAVIFIAEQMKLTVNEIGAVLDEVAVPRKGIVNYGPYPQDTWS